MHRLCDRVPKDWIGLLETEYSYKAMLPLKAFVGKLLLEEKYEIGIIYKNVFKG